MNIKRTFAAVMTAAAVALSFTACGKDEQQSIANSSGAENSQTSSNVSDSNSSSGAASEENKDMWNVIPEIPVTEESAFEYKYDSDLGGMVITDYLGGSEKVRIPDSLEGKRVVKVDLFKSEKELTELILPDGVKDVTLSRTVMNSLQYVNFTVEREESEDIFYEGSPMPNLVGIYIPNGLEELPYGAFADCINLTSIAIPDSVTSICRYAFKRCVSLESLTIPGSVTAIEDDAFYEAGTESLSITYKGRSYDKNSLNDLYVAIRGEEGLTIVDGVLMKVSPDLTEVVITDRVTGIHKSYDGGAFKDCDKVKKVTFGKGITALIGDMYEGGVLQGCTNVEEIVIPEGVTKIDFLAFEGLSSLTTVSLPEGLKTIGTNAFAFCTNLININIPDSVTEISVPI